MLTQTCTCGVHVRCLWTQPEQSCSRSYVPTDTDQSRAAQRPRRRPAERCRCLVHSSSSSASLLQEPASRRVFPGAHRACSSRRSSQQPAPLRSCRAEASRQLRHAPTLQSVECLLGVHMSSPPPVHLHSSPKICSSRYSSSSATETRRCSVESRSRRVTVPSSSVSKSTVTQNGVPTSS